MSVSHFTSLPPELRVKVYTNLLAPEANRVDTEDGETSFHYGKSVGILQLSRQINLEAKAVLLDLNTFILIETPWAQARDHIVAQGKVPVVHRRDDADDFPYSSLRVTIDAPMMEETHGQLKSESFILLADDLPTFTRTWYYADVTYASLNSHLRLKLELQNPDLSKPIKKEMQQKLLLPFGEIKGLQGTEVAGNIRPDPDVEKELQEMQSEEPQSPESCLEEAERLCRLGYNALEAKQYEEALELYRQAWDSIHIVVRGRQRQVHSDDFFNRPLESGPRQGQIGEVVRVELRIQLVTGTCRTYMELHNPQQCIFWGMRSITLLRQRMGVEGLTLAPEEEAMNHLPPALQFGRIYYWTGLAYKAIGDIKEARSLLSVARVYLIQDSTRDSIDKALKELDELEAAERSQ